MNNYAVLKITSTVNIVGSCKIEISRIHISSHKIDISTQPKANLKPNNRDWTNMLPTSTS